jgi:hypothetical protein
MNYYLLSNDTITFTVIVVIAFCVVALLGLRVVEVWLNIENGKALGDYFSTKVQNLESRVDSLENRR